MTGNAGTWRQRVTRHVPASLMEYPFECVTALIAGLMGVALFLGAVRPGSLFTLLPAPVVMTYAVLSLVGAATTFVGLARRVPFVIASGLRLVATLLGVYGVALVSVGGLVEAGFAAAFMLGMSLIGLLRAFYLRAEAHVRTEVR